jgi:hypothetical protein
MGSLSGRILVGVLLPALAVWGRRRLRKAGRRLSRGLRGERQRSSCGTAGGFGRPAWKSRRRPSWGGRPGAGPGIRHLRGTWKPSAIGTGALWRGAGLGALVGAAAGAVYWAVVVVSECKAELVPLCVGFLAAYGAILGAPVGIVGGLFIGAVPGKSNLRSVRFGWVAVKAPARAVEVRRTSSGTRPPPSSSTPSDRNGVVRMVETTFSHIQSTFSPRMWPRSVHVRGSTWTPWRSTSKGVTKGMVEGAGSGMAGVRDNLQQPVEHRSARRVSGRSWIAVRLSAEASAQGTKPVKMAWTRVGRLLSHGSIEGSGTKQTAAARWETQGTPPEGLSGTVDRSGILRRSWGIGGCGLLVG